jgi:hypothetical protein
VDEFDEVSRHAGTRVAVILDSFRRLTGQALIEPSADPARALWRAGCVVLAHGNEADPIFFYGNRRALDLFELRAADLLRRPSRLSAEALLREERAALLERVQRDGYIVDYCGVRIASSGRRFRIERAIVWTLLDERGSNLGQAATFSEWTPLG